jgi:hypothetical protein
MRILPFSNCLRLCYKIRRRCGFASRFAWHTSSTYTLLMRPGAAVSAWQREEPLQPNFRGSWTSCRRFDLWRITSISTAVFPKNSTQRKFKLPITCARTCGISPDKILDGSQSYCLPSRGLSTGLFYANNVLRTSWGMAGDRGSGWNHKRDSLAWSPHPTNLRYNFGG